MPRLCCVALLAAVGAASRDKLGLNEQLASGEKLVSASGSATLEMQASDGNLVLTYGASNVWSSKTAGNPGAHLVLQSAGNLVLYDSSQKAKWASGRNDGVTKAVLRDDCSLILTGDNGAVIWTTGTSCPIPPTPPAPPAPAPPGGQPNIVFLLADDWGWGDVEVYKTILNRNLNAPVTPRLTKLASEGTAFTHFHSLAPECSPARASFLTGRSPSDDKVRIHLVISNNPQTNKDKCACADYIDPSVPTVTSVMHDAGYAVGHFGKWHMGYTSDAPHPEDYGIDESMTYVSNAKPGRAYPENDEWFAANSSRWIVDDGIAFMEAAYGNGQSFYVNLHFHISHAPLRPSPEQLENFPVSMCGGPNPGHQQTQCAMQIYRASQYEADRQIGRLLDWLDSSGLRSNTLFVFATDNGPEDPHIDMHAVGDPGPFRGRKRSLYEGGIRVPFIASWPGKIPSGIFSAADITSGDWLPTVASLGGVSLSSEVTEGLIGRDASALLLGKVQRVPRTIPVMLDYRYDNTMSGHCWHGAPRFAIFDPEDSGLKLLTNADNSKTELFNLTASTFESQDLSGLPEMKSHVERLRSIVLEWSKTLGPLGGFVKDATHMGCEEFAMPSSKFVPSTLFVPEIFD